MEENVIDPRLALTSTVGRYTMLSLRGTSSERSTEYTSESVHWLRALECPVLVLYFHDGSALPLLLHHCMHYIRETIQDSQVTVRTETQEKSMNAYSWCAIAIQQYPKYHHRHLLNRHRSWILRDLRRSFCPTSLHLCCPRTKLNLKSH